MECMRPGVFDSIRTQQNRRGSRSEAGLARQGSAGLARQGSKDVFYTSGLPPLSGRWRRASDGGIEDDPSYALVPHSEDDDEGTAQEKSQSRTCRERGLEVSSSTSFQVVMGLCIVANALVIGLETDLPDFTWWNIIEMTFLLIFSFELCFRLAVVGLKPYFDPNGPDFTWNIFDFLIVTLGLCDTLISVVAQTQGGTATVFRIIRLLRILRIFRIVRFLKQLYMLAFGFALAAVAIFWVTVLMGFLLYVCSVVLVRTVGHLPTDSPHQPFLRERFANIPTSMLTLFELMSSPDLGPYHEVLGAYPLMSLFLIFFIIFGSFGMIALLTGVISESMFDKNQMRLEEQQMERLETRRLIVDHCSELFDTLDVDLDGTASREELHNMLPTMCAFFEREGLDCVPEDLDVLIAILDADQSGSVSREEFCNSILHIAEGVRPLLILETSFMVKYMKEEMKKLKDLSETTSCSLRKHYDSSAAERRMLSASLGHVERKIDELIGMQSEGSTMQKIERIGTRNRLDAVDSDLLEAFGKVREEVQRVWEVISESAAPTVAVRSGGSENSSSAYAAILDLLGTLHVDIQKLLGSDGDSQSRALSNQSGGTGSYNVPCAASETLEADRFGMGPLHEELFQVLNHRDSIGCEIQAVQRGLAKFEDCHAEVSTISMEQMAKLIDGQQHLFRMMETVAVGLTRLQKQENSAAGQRHSMSSSDILGRVMQDPRKPYAGAMVRNLPGVPEAAVKPCPQEPEAVRKDDCTLQHTMSPHS